MTTKKNQFRSVTEPGFPAWLYDVAPQKRVIVRKPPSKIAKFWRQETASSKGPGFYRLFWKSFTTKTPIVYDRETKRLRLAVGPLPPRHLFVTGYRIIDGKEVGGLIHSGRIELELSAKRPKMGKRWAA